MAPSTECVLNMYLTMKGALLSLLRPGVHFFLGLFQLALHNGGLEGKQQTLLKPYANAMHVQAWATLSLQPLQDADEAAFHPQGLSRANPASGQLCWHSLPLPVPEAVCFLLDPSRRTGAPGSPLSDAGHVLLLLPQSSSQDMGFGFKSKQIPSSSQIQEKLALVI